MAGGFDKVFKAIKDERAGNPMGEILGTIPMDSPLTAPGPQGTSTTYATEGGKGVTVAEPPPPWELEDPGESLSDARRFITVPDNWELRWINPKFLEADGWRYWKAISPNDPHVKVKVEQMAMPDGTIRRGGPNGDILAWMYRSWLESARELQRKKTAQQTQIAVDKFEQTREDFNRGRYGPYVHQYDARRAQHPTHTMAEGKSLQKDPA